MRYIIGIDEVGRGSLAGPVAVAAVSIPRGLKFRNVQFGKLRDSKKLTPKKREEWLRFIQKHPHISYAIARVYPRGIERMNISRAANLAALRAFQRLSTRYPDATGSGLRSRRYQSALRPEHRQLKRRSLLLSSSCRVYLDGGLYLGNSKSRMAYAARTVVRGDEKIAAIKLASIVAKVSRDRFMKRLAKKYPRYGFEIHKGYGTKTHIAAIKAYGPSEAHRGTFIAKLR